jgi:large subunit ribosomal protein L15
VKLHHLRPAPGSTKDRVRKGRGDASGRGKTAGRGTKGSKARQSMRIGFEGGQMPLQRRVPKQRGFTNPNKIHWSVVNLDRLQAAFPKGGGVDPDGLVAAGLARKGTPVKVLGQGDVSVALQVRAHAFSATAAGKIAAAGGTVEVV